MRGNEFVNKSVAKLRFLNTLDWCRLSWIELYHICSIHFEKDSAFGELKARVEALSLIAEEANLRAIYRAMFIRVTWEIIVGIHCEILIVGGVILIGGLFAVLIGDAWIPRTALIEQIAEICVYAELAIIAFAGFVALVKRPSWVNFFGMLNTVRRTEASQYSVGTSSWRQGASANRPWVLIRNALQAIHTGKFVYMFTNAQTESVVCGLVLVAENFGKERAQYGE